MRVQVIQHQGQWHMAPTHAQDPAGVEVDDGDWREYQQFVEETQEWQNFMAEFVSGRRR